MTTTNKLWDMTHAALCDGRWSEARRLLDELSTRRDVRDYLYEPSVYGAPSELHGVLGDRIALVNSRVG